MIYSTTLLLLIFQIILCILAGLVNSYSLKNIGIIDCYENSQCGSGQICKDNICKEVTNLMEFQSKQMCRKTTCEVDIDCLPCNTKKRICMDRECVSADSHNKPSSRYCTTTEDCKIMDICDQGECREIRFHELHALMGPQKCNSDTDCSNGEQCNGEMCIKVNNKRENMNILTCSNDDECLNTEICLRNGCIEKNTVILEDKCIFRLLLKTCDHDQDCNICGSKQWLCNNQKCFLAS